MKTQILPTRHQMFNGFNKHVSIFRHYFSRTDATVHAAATWNAMGKRRILKRQQQPSPAGTPDRGVTHETFAWIIAKLELTRLCHDDHMIHVFTNPPAIWRCRKTPSNTSHYFKAELRDSPIVDLEDCETSVLGQLFLLVLWGVRVLKNTTKIITYMPSIHAC